MSHLTENPRLLLTYSADCGIFLRARHAEVRLVTSKQTQARIKNVAVTLFNRHGTKNVSTNLIAEKCGLSRGNLHYHYRTKTELIEAIYDEVAREIENAWYGDEKSPTVRHMAVMFVRQCDLIWRYRFLYREAAALTQEDPELARKWRATRERRIDALVTFFEKMVDAGMMHKPRCTRTLRYLVIISWVLSDNWLNFLELDQESCLNPQACLELGYDLILEMLYPYLTEQAKGDICASYEILRTFAPRSEPACM